MIFQDPGLAFDPVYRVGDQIAEAVKRHDGVSLAEGRKRALELFERVRIPSPERRLDNYPHEMSGGMRQRAMIALALACRPKVLLADEPTTALDATVQIQVLLLIRELQRELGLGVIFVTHDIGVAVEVADRIAVMYGGRIVEMGSCATVIRTPAHPYTRGLLASRAGHAAQKGSRLVAIPGAPPDLANLPPGCAFAPRCAEAVDRCREVIPEPVYTGPHAFRLLSSRRGRAGRAGPRYCVRRRSRSFHFFGGLPPNSALTASPKPVTSRSGSTAWLPAVALGRPSRTSASASTTPAAMPSTTGTGTSACTLSISPASAAPATTTLSAWSCSTSSRASFAVGATRLAGSAKSCGRMSSGR